MEFNFSYTTHLCLITPTCAAKIPKKIRNPIELTTNWGLVVSIILPGGSRVTSGKFHLAVERNGDDDDGEAKEVYFLCWA